MDSEFRPLNEILRELRPLAANKSSGFFFVVTEDNHSCTIRLRNGRIDDVAFSRMRNDDAVQLLSHVNAARARFQSIPVSAASGRGSLSEASLRWLMGGFENDTPASPNRVTPPVAAGDGPREDASGQRTLIEKLALNYFGPIAGILCDEAFAATDDLQQVLSQLAANLPNQNEADRFMAAARNALAALR